ncbi:MAG: pyridoxal-phosphate dependent enzyme [Armatimonadetes bacterium]|nr:pyridoxal-phosphate dependent enzyme [Armatimonadota bacterium]
MVTLEDIRKAQAALPPAIRHTPLARADALSAQLGAPVRWKCENLQVTGSYKARASYWMIAALPEERKRNGVAISSSGNFASATAFAGSLQGVRTFLVMMESTSPFKVEKTRRYGGEVVTCPNNFEARWETLRRLEREGVTVIWTFEEPNVIAGHGTIGLEIVADLPAADLVLVPVSSGGLIAGVATAVKELRPSARVIGVQPEGSNAMTVSWRRGEVTEIPEVKTIADALIARYPGKLPFAHVRKHVDDMVLVSEAEIKQAMIHLAEHGKLVAEAGGAVTTAALLSGKVDPAGGNTVALVSGGNVALETYARILQGE